VKAALRLVAVTALLALLAPAPARACTYVEQPAAQLERAADLIFTGTVVRATRPPLMASTADEVTWTFVVDGREKGPRHDRIDVASAMDEVSCGFEFQIGQRYRVLAYRQGESFRTGLGSGNDELPLLNLMPPIEGDYYRIVVAVPAPVVYAVPVVVLLASLILGVPLARRLTAWVRGSPG
jgi:hypothetical protein